MPSGITWTAFMPLINQQCYEVKNCGLIISFYRIEIEA